MEKAIASISKKKHEEVRIGLTRIKSRKLEEWQRSASSNRSGETVPATAKHRCASKAIELHDWHIHANACSGHFLTPRGSLPGMIEANEAGWTVLINGLPHEAQRLLCEHSVQFEGRGWWRFHIPRQRRTKNLVLVVHHVEELLRNSLEVARELKTKNTAMHPPARLSVQGRR